MVTKLWQCPKCKREFAKRKQAHSCVLFPLANHFKNKEAVRPLFEALKDKIGVSSGPLKIESLPCCIHLVGSYTFGAVWALKDKIRIDFRLDELIESPRIWKMIKMSAHRYLYYLESKDQKEIDQELLGWLKKAYFLNPTS